MFHRGYPSKSRQYFSPAEEEIRQISKSKLTPFQSRKISLFHPRGEVIRKISLSSKAAMNSQIALAKSLGKRVKRDFPSIDFVRDFVQGKQIRIIRSYSISILLGFVVCQMCDIFYDIFLEVLFFFSIKMNRLRFNLEDFDFMINNALFDLAMNF